MYGSLFLELGHLDPDDTWVDPVPSRFGPLLRQLFQKRGHPLSPLTLVGGTFR